jgi:protein involved in polysaccharide export with SLBB domain
VHGTGSPREWRAAAFAAVLALSSLAGASADGETYRLGPNDRLKVEVYGWPALSGEYRIGPEGNINLPLAGELPVDGRSTAEVRDVISERLTPVLGTRPSATVEIAGYRSIYVLGTVASPGAYEYAPGLAILQAIALAGGFGASPAGPDQSAGAIQALREREELDQLLLKQEENEALRARLTAERDGSAITPPAASPDHGKRLEELIAGQQAILEIRAGSLAQSVELLERQAAQYRAELGYLDSHLSSKQEETELLQKLLSDQEELLAQGLVRQSRLVEFQRQVVAAEGESYDISSMQARARQNISRIEQEIAERRAERRNEVMLALQASERTLDSLGAQVANKRAILARLGDTQDHEFTLRFRITRQEEDGKPVTFDAATTTPLRPEDVLEVYLTTEGPGL